MSGAIHLLDDCADEAPLPPSGTRRIDFGISQWSIRATQVSHLSTDLSDHTVVVYTIPWNAPTPFLGPRRRNECVASEDDIAQLYMACDPAKRRGPGCRFTRKLPYVSNMQTMLCIGNHISSPGEPKPNGRKVPSLGPLRPRGAEEA